MKRCGEPMPAGERTYACRNLADHESPHTICGTTDHPHGSTPCTAFGDLIEPVSPMLAAVQADLDGVDIAAVPGGRTYQAMSLWLAGVIDKRGEDDGPSTTAKLADQLTKVMERLTKTKGDGPGDGYAQWSEQASTPTYG